MPGAFDPLNSLGKEERDPVERSERQTGRRLMAFRVAVVLAFLVLGGRLWDMQIVQTSQYVSQAVDNRVRVRTVKALRGVIYDRNQVQLVSNQPSFDLAVDVQDLPSQKEAAVSALLGRLLKADPASIKASIDKQRQSNPTIPVTVASGIAWDTLLAVKEDHIDLPGVIPVQTTLRSYKDGSILSNIEGYVGPISGQEFASLSKEGYEKDDKVGEAGVELTYEDVLRGTNGLQHVEVDAGGREVKVLDEIPPKSGDSLQLTIDANLQKDVNSYLQWGLDRARCFDANQAERVFTANCPDAVKKKMATPVVDGGHGNEGAAVVLDVHTGEVLAMAASPQYDNNVFSGLAADQAKVAAVLTSHDHPLIDRALSAYAPGSTFKPITSAAALQDHVVSPTTTFPVPACWPSAAISFCNWNGQGYSSMGVVDALAQSNDIWMAMVVAGNGLFRGVGPDRLAWYAQQFGIGSPLGIDLPFEQRGLAPTAAWKAANYTGQDKAWYLGDSLNVSIGQGMDLATPLQMADVAAIVANGGYRMVPHVVKAVLDSNGHLVHTVQPQVAERLPVDSQYLETIAQGMRKGVYTGSSDKINLRDLKVAGKTGTAEFVTMGPNGQPVRNALGHLPTDAWWIGFAPYDNPQIAVAVWIHDAGEGADFAVPVARKILARYFHVSDVRHEYGCDTPQTTPAACAASAVWEKTAGYYPDQQFGHEDASDRHDPQFPA